MRAQGGHLLQGHEDPTDGHQRPADGCSERHNVADRSDSDGSEANTKGSQGRATQAGADQREAHAGKGTPSMKVPNKRGMSETADARELPADDPTSRCVTSEG